MLGRCLWTRFAVAMCHTFPSRLARAQLPARLWAAAEPGAAGPPALARWQGDLAVLPGTLLPGDLCQSPLRALLVPSPVVMLSVGWGVERARRG